VTTLPVGSSDIKPADIEILDDGRVVTPAAVVTGERVALGILVDVVLGEPERVWKLLGDVESALSAIPAELTPVRHLNQYKLRVTGRTTPPDFLSAPLDRASHTAKPGTFHSQSKQAWSAADWALASLQFRRGRRVMVVVTDGSRKAMLSPPKFDVGPERQPSFSDFRTRVRSEIAEESGGQVVRVGAADNLRASLSTIADRVAQQSVVYFTPQTPDGRTHRVQVRLTGGGTPLPSPALYLAPKVVR
jgi:hypothetical protein